MVTEQLWTGKWQCSDSSGFTRLAKDEQSNGYMAYHILTHLMSTLGSSVEFREIPFQVNYCWCVFVLCFLQRGWGYVYWLPSWFGLPSGALSVMYILLRDESCPSSHYCVGGNRVYFWVSLQLASWMECWPSVDMGSLVFKNCAAGKFTFKCHINLNCIYVCLYIWIPIHAYVLSMNAHKLMNHLYCPLLSDTFYQISLSSRHYLHWAKKKSFSCK